ncbi:MAG: hypothetical protein LDLANPLL_01402 [Turneriella sp.]|nr:hypothetical protein [Turneriella sp.]
MIKYRKNLSTTTVKIRRSFFHLTGISFLALQGLYCATYTTLKTTKEHRESLEYVGSGSYSNSSVTKLFTKLDKYGNTICDMIYGNIEYNEEIAQDFSKELNFKKPSKEWWYSNMLPALIAGCANFYRMNDRGVHKVFAILEKLFPEEKDCFTVGFTQYYMMRQEMQCTRFVAIDADWRILKAHNEFQNAVRNNSTNVDALTLLQNMQVNWIVDFERKPRFQEKKIRFSTFCMESEIPYCIQAFENFVSLEKIPPTELILGFLHNVEFTPEKGRKTSVVFMSNALDEDYTSLVQFDKLHSRAREYLKVGQKVAFVYQAGDSEDIVVYELLKTDKDEVNISIRCRDNIRWSDQYVLAKRGKPFYTHFDDLLEFKKLRGVPRCHIHGTQNFNDPKKSKKYLEEEKKKRLESQKNK